MYALFTRVVNFIFNREMTLTYGVWDQLRFDKGKEWCLSIFVNEGLEAYRYSRRKPPHVQTSSKKVRDGDGVKIVCSHLHSLQSLVP